MTSDKGIEQIKKLLGETETRNDLIENKLDGFRNRINQLKKDDPSITNKKIIDDLLYWYDDDFFKTLRIELKKSYEVQHDYFNEEFLKIINSLK